MCGSGESFGWESCKIQQHSARRIYGFSGSFSYLLMKDGKTPLIWAARYAKSRKILTVLLKDNANVNAKDNVSPGKMRLL